jgi:phosphoribosylformylglycinamidine cyclo-ligase
VPAICTLVAELGDVPTTEMWDVFNMGCGFVALVPADRAADAVALLGAHHPGTARIGTVTGDVGRLSAPGL